MKDDFILTGKGVTFVKSGMMAFSYNICLHIISIYLTNRQSITLFMVYFRVKENSLFK